MSDSSQHVQLATPVLEWLTEQIKGHEFVGRTNSHGKTNGNYDEGIREAALLEVENRSENIEVPPGSKWVVYGDPAAWGAQDQRLATIMIYEGKKLRKQISIRRNGAAFFRTF